ncbi:MAG: YsnF/AvaK domain-containing protein [Propionibacteriaceae bacterium]
MTITTEQIQSLTGNVYSQSSDKIGSIGQIYLDDTSGEPTWVTVKTGLFGTAETFAPLEGATVEGNDLHLDFAEDKVKNAPRVDADGSITPQEEDHLYTYYGLADGHDDAHIDDAHDDRTETTDNDSAAPVVVGTSTDDRGEVAEVPTEAQDLSEAGRDRSDVSDQTVDRDTSGPTTDDALTRSEERLDVGTATRESGRARLRKYVTTENATQTVPVSHEEVTLEREPITDADHDASPSGPAIGEEEHEIVLHEEVPVVDKDVVAVERVKLGKETVTEDATVSEEIRTENVEIVDPDDTSGQR